MSDADPPELTAGAQRALAAQLFNRTWELLVGSDHAGRHLSTMASLEESAFPHEFAHQRCRTTMSE